ncbi:unnamed protein product [Rotaria sp. Silwood2]|nr:unnamed protein product [Rotaria sp. Silwood2]
MAAKEKHSLSFIENFALSGFAAVVSKTAAAPIERVKLLVQNQGEMLKQGTLSRPYNGVIDFRSHDELLDQIQKLEKSNYLSLNLFAQIEQWKKTTINKVEKAAEKAHCELIKLIDKKRSEITEQLQLITKEIRLRLAEEIFVENDIDQLKQELDKITQKLEKLIQKDKTQRIIVENNQIDWSRLIYIRAIQDEHEIQGKQINCEYSQPRF